MIHISRSSITAWRQVQRCVLRDHHKRTWYTGCTQDALRGGGRAKRLAAVPAGTRRGARSSSGPPRRRRSGGGLRAK
eukprot:2340401-Pleurochrysis_carterae.AAC.1